MKRIKVAVLRGGPSSEYDVSLKTGKNVIDNLSDKYIPSDILIDKQGLWHIDGLPTTPQKVFASHDIVFNALHGEYGEDGRVQQLMDIFKVKYTGSGALASAMGMNKSMAKEIFKKSGLETPIYFLVKKEDNLDEVAIKAFKTFPMPAIVKPRGSGSSVGASKVSTLKEIVPAIQEAFKYCDTVIVEEFIKGKEATCGVVENFRGENIYPLLPVEIMSPDGSIFFDYKAKYSGGSKEICPGRFDKKVSEEIQKSAVIAHKALGLSGYSRSDFIINEKRGVYILETNTLPGLTKESLLPKSLDAIGCKLSQFLDHVITLALNKK